MTKTATWRNTPFAHKFYHSKAWQDTRQLVLDRALGLCERCLEHDELTSADVVHHKVPLSPENMSDPSVTLDPGNLVALCHDCHTLVHKELGEGAMNGRKKEEPRVRFDSEGNVMRL